MHEIRTAAIIDIIANACNLPKLDRDILRSASLLHDACRHGPTATEPYTLKHHANLVRTFIEAQGIESIWTDRVCTIVETHMSRWGIPPYTPKIELRDALIFADFIASQPNIEVRS